MSDSHSYILTSQVLITLEYPQCFQIDYILKYYTTFPTILVRVLICHQSYK